MHSQSPFSFDQYKSIMSAFEGRFYSFEDAIHRSEFVVSRHDVEFDLERALDIAKIDRALKIPSTFFVQVKSESYNVFSPENQSILKEIGNLGFEIGIHLHVSHVKENDWGHLSNEAKNQKGILEHALNQKVDTFSVHRPKNWFLQNKTNELFGMTNVYGEAFFEYSPQPLNIKYLADSRHRWDYGHPVDFLDENKIQILTHPDEWSATGLNERENFEMLLKNGLRKLDKAIEEENSIYKDSRPKFLDLLE